MKRFWQFVSRLFAVFLLVFAVAFAYGVRADRRAVQNARELCSGIEAGSEFATAARQAAGVGDDRLRLIRDDSIAMGFVGISPFSRHLCTIERDGDRVGAANYRYLD